MTRETAPDPRSPAAPLRQDQLEPVLQVIEAAQSMAAGDDVPAVLADLSRQLTTFLNASACMISLLDDERGILRDRAGYARPPFHWEPTPDEYDLADYPSTEAVMRTGQPYTCTLDSAGIDPAEEQWLRELGFGSLLMYSMSVEGEPYALVEIYDERRRSFHPAELRLATALAAEAGTMVARARMSERLEDAYFATLGTLAAALEAKDAYTNDHASKIAELAGRVCDQLDLAPADVRVIRLAALLHDIGKIGIPESILRKPGSLTGEEMMVMQRHPDIGARILEPVPYFADLVPLVRSSHERWDGRGYPDGLAGEQIPLGSRVIAVCDAFHAMTEDRIYRRAMPLHAAIAEAERCAGSQFDPI
ncbi:MAG TPA: HD domain-containing phosphohydrolase, partial [Gaiellales bacterium]|nr:HD domain-containing phosphohydrolase [Gaiellales bacterium]